MSFVHRVWHVFVFFFLTFLLLFSCSETVKNPLAPKLSINKKAMVASQCAALSKNLTPKGARILSVRRIHFPYSNTIFCQAKFATTKGVGSISFDGTGQKVDSKSLLRIEQNAFATQRTKMDHYLNQNLSNQRKSICLWLKGKLFRKKNKAFF